MAEHPFRMWDPFHRSPVSEQIRSTDLNESTPIQDVSYSLVFVQITEIRSTDWNGWTLIQAVSHSLVFEQIRSTDLNGWTPIQNVSCFPVFEQTRSTDQTWNGWTPIQRVSPFQCLSRSDPLTRMAEHPSRMWVTWLGLALQDQIHWPKWLNNHSGCEPLFFSSVLAD